MNRSTTTTLAILAALGLAALSVSVIAQQSHMRSGGMMGGMMHKGMMKGGIMGGGMMNGSMPMLNGGDTTPAEVEEMRVMFQNHPDITRSVTNLPDGIETLTESTDPDLAAAIVSHVLKMAERMETGRDPMVPIQSPTLQILFERGDRITTEMTPTESGIKVRQTSKDPEVVAALQTHAAEVSDLAARGMAAVRDSMMQRRKGGHDMGMMQKHGGRQGQGMGMMRGMVSGH